MSEPKKKEAATYRIPDSSPWASAWRYPALLGAIGLAIAAYGYTSDPHRFAFSWLFAFMTFLAIALGSLFLILGLHLTGAAWGVTVRRTTEFLAAALPVFILLFIPLLLSMNELYPWVHHAEEAAHEEAAHEDAAHEEGSEHGALFGASGAARAQDHGHAEHADAPGGDGHGPGSGHDAHHTPEHAAHEAAVEAKLGYLNPYFFMGRAAFYLLAWTVLALFFFFSSTRQDKEKGLSHTQRMRKLAPLCTFVFGLTLTFAAFDWMMSLEPTWFSTIYGVQYFAVSAVSSLSTLVVLTMAMRQGGLLGDAVNVEHYHDIGKLLFGFLVFWAYVSFSQFMLIWYAGIPEEASYYHLRWWGGGGFLTTSVVLVLLHFVVPFFILISRNTKRRLPILTFGAIWLLVMHVVEVYWLVMPYASRGTAEPGDPTQVFGGYATVMQAHWLDVAALLAVGGVYLTVVLLLMRRYPLIPVGDPLLSRSLHHENA